MIVRNLFICSRAFMVKLVGQNWLVSVFNHLVQPQKYLIECRNQQSSCKSSFFKSFVSSLQSHPLWITLYVQRNGCSLTFIIKYFVTNAFLKIYRGQNLNLWIKQISISFDVQRINFIYLGQSEHLLFETKQ